MEGKKLKLCCTCKIPIDENKVKCKKCISEYNKIYKEKLKKSYIKCECGMEVKQINIFVHRKTKIHKTIIEIKSNEIKVI